MTEQQAERIAALLERILALMERAADERDERDEPLARPARVVDPVRGKHAA